MPTVTVTIPNSGRVPTVLLTVAARDGFQVGATYPTAQDALTAWLRARLRDIYREQARAGLRDQAILDAEVQIQVDANTIT